MKQIIAKTLILALYLTTLLVVWSVPGLFGDFSLLVVRLVLAYCGIVVLAQLISAALALCHWCVAASQEEQGENFINQAVFEVETEAT